MASQDEGQNGAARSPVARRPELPVRHAVEETFFDLRARLGTSRLRYIGHGSRRAQLDDDPHLSR